MTREEYLAARVQYGRPAKKQPLSPDAPAAASQPKEPAMAAAAQQAPQNGGEYKKPDAAKAFEIYDRQIKPKKGKIAEIKGDLSQPYDDIKEHAHFPRKVLDFIVSLGDLEDDKRDHFLLALSAGLAHRKLFLPRDLVTIADGTDGADVIPIGERTRPQLATLAGDPNLQMGQPSDGTETDLADVATSDLTEEEVAAAASAVAPAGEGYVGRADDDFTEASPEELAAQEGRPDRDSDNDDDHGVTEAAE